MSAALSLPRCSGGFLGPAVTQTLEQQALSVVSQPPWASLTELLSLKRILKGSIYQMSGIFRPRCLNDLFRRAVLHNLSFAHHQHPITERLHQSQIMADKQKRKSLLLLQRVQQLHNLLLNRHIQSTGGLVTNQQLRPDGQCTGESRSLALAAAYLVGITSRILW